MSRTTAVRNFNNSPNVQTHYQKSGPTKPPPSLVRYSFLRWNGGWRTPKYTEYEKYIYLYLLIIFSLFTLEKQTPTTFLLLLFLRIDICRLRFPHFRLGSSLRWVFVKRLEGDKLWNSKSSSARRTAHLMYSPLIATTTTVVALLTRSCRILYPFSNGSDWIYSMIRQELEETTQVAVASAIQYAAVQGVLNADSISVLDCLPHSLSASGRIWFRVRARLIYYYVDMARFNEFAKCRLLRWWTVARAGSSPNSKTMKRCSVEWDNELKECIIYIILV